MSTPASSKWVANVCRKTCDDPFLFTPAFFMFLSKSFLKLPAEYFPPNCPSNKLTQTENAKEETHNSWNFSTPINLVLVKFMRFSINIHEAFLNYNILLKLLMLFPIN